MIYNARKIFNFCLFFILFSGLFVNVSFSSDFNKNQIPPNVIVVMTDDQGIGDLSCHGNPYLKTPNLDAFYEEAIRLTDFHVSPLCTPTRGAIMTGCYPINNGAWATFKGRDALSEKALTMADIFKQNGYKTGLFGKWHLGDNYPVRPTDCGFDVAVHHLAGGVGELSDYWGNSYFNDVYYVNNEPKQFQGYCTDIWFREAMKFIESSKDQPFFIYLPTNAPHAPLIVADEYAEPYKNLEDQKIQSADYLGMIANIDENFGKLDEFLKENNLSDNTILIFLTDNGTQFGYSEIENLGYNKGFRGNKGEKLEGGHRVPFFIRWANGEIACGRDIDELTAHVDMLPTLASLCGLSLPEDIKLDGVDFSPLLTNEKESLPQRTVFVHHRQDWRPPLPIDGTCLMKDNWRLIDGNKLYNVKNDPEQKNNLFEKYPDIVSTLLESNKEFLYCSKKNPEYNELPVHVIGSPKQEEIKLTIQHAIGEDKGIWKSDQVAAGMKNRNNKHALKVESEGLYEIRCCRWPKECPGKIWGIPEKNPKGGMFHYKTISPEKVRIQIANQIIEKDIASEDEAVIFNVKLKRGKTFITNDFIEGNEKYGVYYTYIRYLGNGNF